MAFDGFGSSSVERQQSIPPAEELLSREEMEYIAAEREAKRLLEEKEAIEAQGKAAVSPAVEAQVESGAGVDPLVSEIEGLLKVDVGRVLSEPLATEALDRFVAEEKSLAHRIFEKREHIDPLDVVKWIEQWLHQLPKVNKHYLQQEARNKTEAIIALLRAGSS